MPIQFIPISERRLIEPGDRLFPPMNDLLIIMSAIAHASSLITDGSTHKHPSPTMRVDAMRIGHAYILPLRGPLERALAGTEPTSIEVGITPSATYDAKFHGDKLHTGGLDGVMTNVISPIFLAFFEPYNDWLDKNLGTNAAVDWPSTLNFARVVRNSIAHHGIDIRSRKAPPVTWRGLSYDHSKNGRKIIGVDIRMGDLIGLIFEVNDELDRVNAPAL